MDTSQKTESLKDIVDLVERGSIALPEFQRDFVWEESKTYDLFDSLVRDIFIGSLIYGIPSFELTVRELDARQRKGDGSRKKLKLTSYTKKEINEMVKTGTFRLLLDGQQRTTAIYRALSGIDDVWFIAKREEELEPEVRKKKPAERSLEEVLYAIHGKQAPDRLSIRLADAHSMMLGKWHREKEKASLLEQTQYAQELKIEDIGSSEVFDQYLAYTSKLQDLYKSEKLLSYYLLDTDEEKFSLFFERSNSKGIQLNFIDILCAKLYVGFNLRESAEAFKSDNPELKLNRDTIVRAISFIVSDGKDIEKGYILKNLTHAHFSEYWEHLCILYKKCLSYLDTNHLLLSQLWNPYENMIIPLMIFLREIPHNDFSQITETQSELVKYWYWSAILSERYSGGAQERILADARVLRSVARDEADFSRSFFRRFQYQITKVEDLFYVHKKGSALYKGILNLINYKSQGLLDWKNTDKLSFNSKLEDHHIFPREYLKPMDLEDSRIDCVLNRTLIPKITNIKIGKKAPSQYLAELQRGNANIPVSLQSHMVPVDLIGGNYDECYQRFLEDRGQVILDFIQNDILPLGAKLEVILLGEESEIEQKRQHVFSD